MGGPLTMGATDEIERRKRQIGLRF